MSHYQEKVKEFMKVFGQDCPDKPVIPDLNTRILRVKLVLEEVLELAEASGLKIIDSMGFEINKSLLKNPNGIQIVENPNIKPDIIEVADAIADISYVNYGAANAYGINIKPVEDEVHYSNMTKLFFEDEVKDLDRVQFSVDTVPDINRYLVKNTDGKVQKSPSYKKADIKTQIDIQLNK
jgi:predicted HAD superfamily Cof-like phosphohydrolase